MVAIFAVLAGDRHLAASAARCATSPRLAAIGAVRRAAHRVLARCRSCVEPRQHDRHALRAASATTSTGCSCPRTGSCTRSPSSRSAPGSAYRRRATLDVAAHHGDDRAGLLQLGGCCASSWARRRRGTCGCCRSGTSCSSCSRRWASPSSRGSPRLGVGVGGQGVRPTPTGSHALDAAGGARAARRRRRRRPQLRTRRPSVVACRATPCGSIAIAVLAVVATTVALVRVQQTRGFLPYWAKYNYTGYESGTTADFTAKSWPEYRAFLDTANSLAARSHGVGGRRRDRRVRHAARAHAAAVLDPRSHPVDGGPVLRGVDDDAVPLHDGRDARAGAVEPGARAARTARSPTSTSACGTCS